MKVGDNYKRKDSITGKWSEVKTIETPNEATYHNQLQAQGIVYLLVHNQSDATCISCEG